MKSKLLLLLRLTSAVIMLQTLFFKFTGAPESIYIFETLGMEPYGRYVSGIGELFASVLLLSPGLQVFGAVVAMNIMLGAILSHVTVLGVVVQDDGGLLFTLACVVFLASGSIVFLQRETVFPMLRSFQRLLRRSHQ